MPVLELWHGTNEDIEVFDTSASLGVHFGTCAAAAHRLAATGRREYSDGESAVPRMFSVTIESALVLPDLGVWSFQSVMRQLRELRVTTVAQTDAAYEALNRSDAEGWSSLKRALRLAGYDGIKYVNLVEDEGSASWIALDSSQIEPRQAPRAMLVDRGG